MTPATVMGALIELESASGMERPRTLARLLGIEDEGAIDLIRRALQMAASSACDSCIYNEDL